ncbi:integrase [Streptomyces tateyamensis]|uniref:Integrase n=1 Tax=Streptomyces tateyamensis TaxID=565073 RepID=A0A2V4N856_9ACTN|nr:protein phosphatase 2C domain-containing protein [Streptomyces tateyamensis]PYC79310.1 integrase [Streptomyces tateyamensis]
MRIEIATEPAYADRPNEDFVAASPNAVVLLDGAGTPAGSDSGCVHGVAWYVSRLGVSLLAEVTNRPDEPLADCLAKAITQTAELHRDTCDLSHPGTPSATVIITRLREHDIEYLVLADSSLVLDRSDKPAYVTITDDREAQVGAELRRPMDAEATGTQAHAEALCTYVEAMRAHRNRSGGFWVAAADPAAAHEAMTGTFTRDKVSGFSLFSDGASRLVDRFTLSDWTETLTLIRDHGPAEVIRQVRAAEHSDPDGKRWPRGKAHDDATVATVTL